MAIDDRYSDVKLQEALEIERKRNSSMAAMQAEFDNDPSDDAMPHEILMDLAGGGAGMVNNLIGGNAQPTEGPQGTRPTTPSGAATPRQTRRR